jgi:hypothetical protein
MQEYQECNGQEIDLLDAKRDYAERFIADKCEYIDEDNISVYFV